MSQLEQLYVGQVDHLKRDLAGNLLRFINLEVTGHENLKLLNGSGIFHRNVCRRDTNFRSY